MGDKGYSQATHDSCLHLCGRLMFVFNARPTGSRFVGGSTPGSDYDMIASEEEMDPAEIAKMGFGEDAAIAVYHGIDKEFKSFRHSYLPVNIIIFEAVYYQTFKHASETVWERDKDTLYNSTREMRVAAFEKRELEYKESNPDAVIRKKLAEKQEKPKDFSDVLDSIS